MGSGSVWHDGTGNSYPDWVQINFNGSKSINEIDVFTLQDNYTNPSEPAEQMTFSMYGLLDFQVQYWNGSSWQFEVTTDAMTGNNLECISVSGPGARVALGTPNQMQVVEIPNGKTVYAGPGRFPRLSPDGKRLAFVDREKLWIHSFADGSTVQLLKGKRVMGVGGWSPDGQFLLAGAWTTVLAFEKRQIIVDTNTGEYAATGKLEDGDYGSQLAWVSVKLLR